MLNAVRRPSLIWAAALILTLSFHYVFMRTAASMTTVHVVPLWADQVQYLMEAYRGLDLIRLHGPTLGFFEAITLPRIQGWLVQTFASVHMSIVGPGRMAALDVNLFLATAWLGLTAVALKRRFGTGASLCALGLLISAATFNLGPGGPFDFRLDFAATCQWGMLVALVSTATGRERGGYYIAVAGVGLALLLSRLLSGFYLIPFGVALAALAALFSKPGERLRGSFRWWIIVTLWAAALAVVIAMNFDTFAGYYIRGHVTGDEASVRRLVEGLRGIGDDLVFYPRRVMADHLGGTFTILSLVFLVSMGALQFIARRMNRPADERSSAVPDRSRDFWFAGVVGLALLIPYAVLTINAQKSSPVAGIFVGPLAVLVAGIAAWGAARRAPIGRATLVTLGVLAIAVGFTTQRPLLSGELRGLPPRGTLLAYNQMIDDIQTWLTARSSGPVRWSLDAHHVEISSTTIQVALYERTGSWVDIRNGLLGQGPIERPLTEAEILAEARNTNVLIVTDRPAPWIPNYPADASVRSFHTTLLAEAREHMRLLGSYDVSGVQFWLFVR